VPAAVRDIKLRAVRIRPDVVARLEPVGLDVVTEHLDLPASGRFDLIVATNVFVYYDVFEQCLALAEVERMLRPGGFLLSNNALLELPGSRIRSVGYRTVVYSDRRADGEHIVWYARLPDR
jgi:SAM-dependent methyltransferase